MRDEASNGEHHGRRADAKFGAELASVALGIELLRVRAEIDRGDWRRCCHTHFTHYVVRECRSPFGIGDHRSGITEQSICAHAFGPVARCLAPLVQQVASIHVHHVRNLSPLMRPPDRVTDRSYLAAMDYVDPGCAA